jgi:preprotein translocase subunit SecY
MISQLREAVKLPDLRSRMFFMLWGFFVFELGRHVPLPQINPEALARLFGDNDSLFGMLNMFSGGALKQFSIFALGVMPYINASIMLQLLTVALPSLKKLAQEGETGRQQIAMYTRWLTVVLAIFQSLGLTTVLKQAGGGVNGTLGIGAQLGTVVSMTAGTMFLLWLGEQITEKGIGNGVSLVIFIGIMVNLPQQIAQTLHLWFIGSLSFVSVAGVAVFFVLTVVGIIFIQQGERQIRVQYARRVVGTRMMGGASTYLPMKVNQAGVMPIIFAISVALFPKTIFTFIPYQADWWVSIKNFVSNYLTPNTGSGLSMFVSLGFYFVLVVGFTFFYTSVTYDPTEVADNLKKWGGQIKGIRAGAETARFIDRVLTRITFAGALFLGVLALLQYVEPVITKVHTFGLVGGTSLLIVIGVALETMQQIEAHLLMRHYKGFIG